MTDRLIVKGAKENNLKNISLNLPKHQLIVITGLSGSGKSTLAFDTIYAEGQRRYMESLSAYARQFLNQLDKPDVDSIEGLSPAISIDQKVASYNPRSTVGTVTEIYDYLRLFFASLGQAHCPSCEQPITAYSIQEVCDVLFAWAEGAQIMVLAPIVKNQKGGFHQQLSDLKKAGFVRVKINDEIHRLDALPVFHSTRRYDISLVVDRLTLEKANFSRLFQSIETAFSQSSDLLEIENLQSHEKRFFSQHYHCAACDQTLLELSNRLFSFNSPVGACSACKGLGYDYGFDVDLLFPNKEMPIKEAMTKALNLKEGRYAKALNHAAKALNFSNDTIFSDLNEEQQHLLLYGGNQEQLDESVLIEKYIQWHEWIGVIPLMKQRLARTASNGMRFFLRQFMSKKTCLCCQGNRLNAMALAVKVENESIASLCNKTVDELRDYFTDLKLSDQQRFIAKQVLKELHSRLSFLSEVGLSYLTLSRASSTLSGGEFQRIRLATQIGSGLTGVLYVLDEPSIGLHQRDNEKLLVVLQRLKSLGNTLIVVEHDEDAIRAADYVVDIGPAAGKAGGEVMFAGTQLEFQRDQRSLTAQFMRKEKEIKVPAKTREVDFERVLKIHKANLHNLKNVSVDIPLGCFVVVTGVSGSGKSTLIYDVLYEDLKKYFASSLYRGKDAFASLQGLNHIDKVIPIDQSPIGRTPRSNPITYTGVFSAIRDLFVKTREARIRGYKAGRFSFNVKGGRCEACSGDGVTCIEMHFLSDVYVTCEVCQGKRYNRETLDVLYKGKSIADVLSMTVNEASIFFENVPSIFPTLQVIKEVGLGYFQLGQSATTLSGGEAQRVKLAKELSRRSTGKTLYLLDEPTTGLHFADVENLLGVLQRLVNTGNTVLIVEHHLDVIKVADYVIDLGPEGGNKGGKIVAKGRPQDIVQVKKSHTGRFLKQFF